LRRAFIFVPLVLLCFGLSPRLQAVTPAPDGAYLGANTAEGGSGTLFSLTTGTNNTAVGSQALFSLTTGQQNTAVGAQALRNNRANDNTAYGFQALALTTTGFENAATGWRALFSNTIGFHNTADGFSALSRNTVGNHNTANGDEALGSNTTGSFNTTDGAHSLENNTTGIGNTALGFGAGDNITTASDVICIGAGGANVSNSCFIGQIFDATSSAGIAVFINSSGRLGTTTSSQRFKQDIEPMAKTSEALFGLKPASFRYNKEYDATQTLAFGLIAEEVAEVYPDLVGRNARGQPESVRYDQINAMLLNEFLKEHSKVKEQATTIAQLKTQMEAVVRQVKEQALQIQKVSAQIELNKSVPRVVLTNQ